MNDKTTAFLESQSFIKLDGLTGAKKNQHGWIRCKALPDIYILLDDDATIDDVIEAIYQAGIQTHARLMRDKWRGFQELFSRAEPLPPEAESVRTAYLLDEVERDQRPAS